MCNEKIGMDTKRERKNIIGEKSILRNSPLPCLMYFGRKHKKGGREKGGNSMFLRRRGRNMFSPTGI
jgi:hypothetical protein